METPDALQKAIQYHQAGNLIEAENIYQKILDIDPNNFYALHYLGVLHFQYGNHDKAIKYINKALMAHPDAHAYYNLGLVYQGKKLFNKAISSYRNALKLNPEMADAYVNLGIIYKEKMQLEKAIKCLKEALRINPNHIEAYNNLGIIYKELQMLNEAIECFQKVLTLNPNIVSAFINLGFIFKENKQFNNAITCFQKVIQINPNLAKIYINLGIMMQEEGKFDEAIDNYQKALSINPNLIDAYCNLGIVFKIKGYLDEAIKYYQKALQLDSERAELYCNLGNVLTIKKQFDGAINNFKKAIQINPFFTKAYNNLGVALKEKGELKEAIENFHHALSLKPDYAEAYSNLGGAYKDQGRSNEAEECFKQALLLNPSDPDIYSSLLLFMNYNPKYDAQDLLYEHLRFEEKVVKPLSISILPHANKCIQNRKLKIGYVSPDFRSHSVSYFIKGIISAHSRECFEVFCYSNVLVPDEMTFYFKTQCDHWRDIVGISDEKASELIRADGIDILVDLAGHTAGNRLLLFARKPAPIQITWIGYPCTTGLHSIDYKIVDDYTDPPKATEKYYSEKLIRMPECFLCYQPEVDSPEVRDLPALNTGYITFGSFNNFAKISSNILLLWIEILRRLPKACLIIKAKSLSDTVTREEFLKRFNEEGIDSGRIKLLRWEPTIRRHLELYNSIDIALDTYPYNGTTTTCEALWMGVPVITLAGRTHASRVGVSLLSNVGLQGLIAKTKEEYIEIAIDLAKDLNKLRLIRRGLRYMMQSSPLTDNKRFTKNLEDSYRDIWVRWCTDKAK